MKILSPDIAQKSDVGGVTLSIRSREEPDVIDVVRALD